MLVSWSGVTEYFSIHGSLCMVFILAVINAFFSSILVFSSVGESPMAMSSSSVNSNFVFLNKILYCFIFEWTLRISSMLSDSGIVIFIRSLDPHGIPLTILFIFDCVGNFLHASLRPSNSTAVVQFHKLDFFPGPYTHSSKLSFKLDATVSQRSKIAACDSGFVSHSFAASPSKAVGGRSLNPVTTATRPSYSCSKD